MFNGKIHYKWPFSIAMLVYQRVNHENIWTLWIYATKIFRNYITTNNHMESMNYMNTDFRRWFSIFVHHWIMRNSPWRLGITWIYSKHIQWFVYLGFGTWTWVEYPNLWHGSARGTWCWTVKASILGWRKQTSHPRWTNFTKSTTIQSQWCHLLALADFSQIELSKITTLDPRLVWLWMDSAR